jgi:hypothetical protein
MVQRYSLLLGNSPVATNIDSYWADGYRKDVYEFALDPSEGRDSKRSPAG